MGLEANCKVEFEDRQAEGKARLEEKELIFRGGFNLKIPLADLSSYDVAQGALRVRWNRSEALFHLGSRQAEKWWLKIRYPKNLLDKLGIKPDQRVLVLGVDDAEFWTALRDRTDRISDVETGDDADFVLFRASVVDDLKRLEALRRRIKKTGAIWVLWAKGRPELKEDHVRRTASQCGLVDVKVVSFSSLLSGLKLMIPRELR